MTDRTELAREILGGEVLSIPEGWEEVSEAGAYRLFKDAKFVRSFTWNDWDETGNEDSGFYTGWVGTVDVYWLPLYKKFLVELSNAYCGNCFDDRSIGFYLADEA